MLNDEYPRNILNTLRKRLQETGFQSFDRHAISLLITISTDEEISRIDNISWNFLESYIAIVHSLLSTVGKSNISKIKNKLRDLLGTEGPISLELNTEAINSLTGSQENEVLLDGFTEADEMVQRLGTLLQQIEAYQYSSPTDDPSERGPQP